MADIYHRTKRTFKKRVVRTSSGDSNGKPAHIHISDEDSIKQTKYSIRLDRASVGIRPSKTGEPAYIFKVATGDAVHEFKVESREVQLLWVNKLKYLTRYPYSPIPKQPNVKLFRQSLKVEEYAADSVWPVHIISEDFGFRKKITGLHILTLQSGHALNLFNPNDRKKPLMRWTRDKWTEDGMPGRTGEIANLIYIEISKHYDETGGLLWMCCLGEDPTLGKTLQNFLFCGEGRSMRVLDSQSQHLTNASTGWQLPYYGPSQDEKGEFIKLIKENKIIKRNHAHSIFVGPPGSGKSSLMDRLLSRARKDYLISTGLSDSVVIVNIDVDNLSTFCAVTVTDSSWNEVDYGKSLVRQLKEELPVAQAKMQTKGADATGTGDKPYVKELTAELVSHHVGTVSSAKPVSHLSYEDIDKMFLSITTEYGSFEKLKSSYSLYLRDTGGQVEFQEMIALLIFGPSIFIFVFRVDLEFQGKFSIEYRVSKSKSTNSYTSSITIEEALLQCLASVYAMDTSSTAGVQTHKPLVFIVGTHVDRLDPPADTKKIAELDSHLDSLIKKNGFQDIVQYADDSSSQVIFPVDNTSSNDADIKPLRSKIHSLVSKNRKFSVEYPVSYLLFCLDLQKKQYSTLSLDECKDIAAKYGIVGDQVSHLLQFLHLRIGVIQYFNVDGLRHIVVKEPQVLFNKVTNLIIRTFSSRALTSSEWVEFRRGIVTASVLESVVRSNDRITTQDFLKLLLHLRIITHYPSTTDSEERYFIPCVLKHAQESSEEDLHTDVLPLYVQFQCSHCPKGLFGVLVTHLMTPECEGHGIRTSFALILEKIFRDQVSFEVKSLADQDTLSLRMFPSHLQVNFYPSISLCDHRDMSIGEVCSDVRQIIEMSIHRSLENLHYNQDQVKPLMCFKCEECPDLHHVNKGNKMYCRTTNTMLPIPLNGRCWYNEAAAVQSPREGADSSKQITEEFDRAYEILKEYSHKWKTIGQGLGFKTQELDNIMSRPLLLFDAPNSYLSAMLSEWQLWAPGDHRGSNTYATLHSLRMAVDKAGLGLTAQEL